MRALILQLKNTDPKARRKAFLSLRRLGPAANAAVPALIEALEDRDLNVRYPTSRPSVRTSESTAAAGALGRIGPDARDAVPALAQALKDTDIFLRANAAEALGKIGPAAREAVPALVAASKDTIPYVRGKAEAALKQIGQGAAAADGALAEWKRERERAAARLNELREAGVPALVEALKDADSSVRWGVLSELRKRSALSETAVPALIEALGDTDPRVRYETVAA
ncbi:MAG: HEAT repeat domain-containing protein, partial [Planctomycetota bacterium]